MSDAIPPTTVIQLPEIVVTAPPITVPAPAAPPAKREALPEKAVPDRQTYEAPNTETKGGRLYWRTFKLTISDEKKDQKGGFNEFDLSDFHFIFTVDHAQLQTPKKLVCTIYNLHPKVSDIIAGEFTQVRLEVGYKDDKKRGELFKGFIVWTERGKENATDTYLTIWANSWDGAITSAVVNETLPKGSTSADVFKACVRAMATYGVSLGFMSPGLSKTEAPRARTISGSAKDVLRDMARSEGAEVFVDADRVNTLKWDETMPGPTIVLNSKTGMLDIPKQTPGGVTVRSLMNAQFRPGMAVKIDETDIVRQQRSQGAEQAGALPEQNMQLILSQAAVQSDGVYKIHKVVHHGDTRGDPWYSDITTMPIKPAAPALR